ncbi:hypothetical protein [Burkholderia ubonensis]|uniref:hypothetical protein n=1 Tax=Burkholderia ubonensis TaxID=101571 RepID=UPI000B2873E9|nr:hypothetical protein [Burkholderia ubonensis]
MSAQKVTKLRERAKNEGTAQATINGMKVTSVRGADDKIRFRVDGAVISERVLLALVA